MAVTTTEIFLLALLLILCVPWLIWRLGRTDHYAPLVVVQIICGILLGPGVLGALWPDYYAFVFSPEVVAPLNGIAWWAVMMFVFSAGVELDLSDAWANRRETGLTAALALATPLLFGTAAAAILLALSNGWIGPKGTPVQVMLGIGMACAVTALPILVLLMEKMAIFHAPLGQRILRYASLDDLAIWGVLALILLDWERIGRQVAFMIVFGMATVAVRWLMRRIGDADRWFAGLAWLVACALGADWAGLHYMVGAFLAGVVLDAAWFGREALDRFRQFLLLAVMPVFFLSTGLKTHWGEGSVMAVIGAAVLLLLASVGGKLAGVHMAGRMLGWTMGEAGVIGWLLQTKALIMIIFAQVLLDRGIITPATFTALLLMAVGSTMLTTPMVKPRLAALFRGEAGRLPGSGHD